MKITWAVILVALFVLFGGFSFAVEMYFDYLWFDELGKTIIFTRALYAKSIVGSIALLGTFLFLYINFWFANKGPGLIQLGIPTPTGQITAYTMPPETVRRVSGLAAALVGLLVAIGEASNWERIWRWLNAVPFNINDPIFSRDVSFYFFTMPFMRELVRVGLTLCFLALAGALILYYFKGTLNWKKLNTPIYSEP